tara:strand:- start:41 stop:646 length:606 start_codon:yes stop_codon:yes gene_type:complete
MSKIPALMGGRALEHGLALLIDHGRGSGEKMHVGGQAKATVADGTSHENTVTEGSLDRLAIPANTLVAGSTLRIWASGIVEDNNSTDTLTVLIRLGTSATVGSNEAVFTSTAVDSADADVYALHGVIQIRTAGSSGTAVAMFSFQDPDAAATTPAWQVKASFAVDTTSKLHLDFAADWSVAHEDNETNSTMFVVDIVNPST